MIGERLAEVRKDHADTQSSLANKLSVSVATIRSWEQEKSAPLHDTLVAICQMYQVSSDYLLGLTNDDPLYSQRRRKETLDADDMARLKEFEEFLVWKHKKAPTHL